MYPSRIAFGIIVSLIFLPTHVSSIHAAGPCPLAGDTNTCDGLVNVLDYSFLTSKFGTTEPKADLNSDGTVNILDFQFLAQYFGRAGPTPTTPTVTGTVNTAPIDQGFYPDLPYPSAQQLAAGIPDCPTHDKMKWHALYDPSRNCYYSHEHKADPTVLDTVFGPVDTYLGGQTISYPWQTYSLSHLTPSPNYAFNYPSVPTQPGKMENELKHDGYLWYVLRSEVSPYLPEVPCKVQAGNEHNCITKARVQVHALASGHDALIRAHSVWVEIYACEKTGKGCGIIRTGGWADYGRLELPYKGGYFPLPGDDPSFDCPTCVSEQFSYRGHPPTTLGTTNITWGAKPGTIANMGTLGTVGLRFADGWDKIDKNNPTQLNLICPNYNCPNNGSKAKVYVVGFQMPSQLAALDNGTGFVTWSGWTDRYGKIVTNCSQASLDCVPLVLEHAPVGFSIYFIGYHVEPLGPFGSIREFDTSPPGQFRIKYLQSH